MSAESRGTKRRYEQQYEKAGDSGSKADLLFSFSRLNIYYAFYCMISYEYILREFANGSRN